MKKISISKGWHLDAPGYNGMVDLPNDYAISLPRDPNAAGRASNGFFSTGIGKYRKELAVDAAPRHYILNIDGAYMCASIRCNGSHVIMHPSGYAPILVDLTRRLRAGENNVIEIETAAHQRSTRWYSGAGLYRDVYLWEGGDIRIEPWDVFVTTPTTDTVRLVCQISADRTAAATLRAEILNDGKAVAAAETEITVTADEKTTVSLTLTLPDAKLWSPEHPHLYTMHTTVLENGVELDANDTVFGVRTISVDASNGLLLNGQSIKLRGGCIHHDHGVIGVADYPAACRRKLTRLKEAGFNAIRTAHNPPSLQLLEMCDEMGIIVMDEAFDVWREPKGGEFNYHLWFDGWWDKDLAAMVLRDRNHPCVFSYSIGNEVPESFNGNPNGGEWSAILAAEVRKYDTTRPVTSATFHFIGDLDAWADMTEPYFTPLDICGYNYAYYRYERDHERYPERVIWGSETHALTFYDSWNTVLRSSHVIGDFTWTAYDNLGEAGTGRACWERDGKIEGLSLGEYPWRSCYQGDIDLCGNRRPQSYFREAIWFEGTEPRIFTTHPEHYGEGYTGTGWHWYDVLDSWTFDDSYLGKPVKCEVYTDAEEIHWFVNGRAVGVSKPEKAIAVMDIPYEKGEISVIAYKHGKDCGRSSLHTVGEPAAILVEAETDTLCADNRDLCYFDITVTDGNGDRIPYAENELHCSAEGGKLMGIFSANPCNEDAYGSDTCHAFKGRALAIVRTDKPGNVRITVISNGLASGSAAVYAPKE